MTQLFERLKLQAHFKRLFDQHGVESGWQLIQQAVELESRQHQTTPEPHEEPAQEQPCES
jgi:hypothetical protein